MSDFRTQRQLLEEAARIASSLRQTLKDAHVPPARQLPPDIVQLEAKIPEMDFPFPHEILLEFSALRIPNDIRQAVISSLQHRIRQMQQVYLSSYRRTCMATYGSSLSPNFKDIQRIYQAYSEGYLLPTLRAHLSVVLAKVAQYQKLTGTDERRTFNSEFTPFLEKYFEYNAYPSARHQMLLAEKSMMTRRQIEVWFQNHRNRSKKAEASLKRNTSDLPLHMALNVLDGSTSGHLYRTPSPSDEDFTSERSEDEDQTHETTSCLHDFDDFRPYHAFPKPYPPIGPDPFPLINGVAKFPPPVWLRKPAKPIPRQLNSPPVDVDELTRVFHAKLHIFEGVRKRSSASKSTTKPHSPWYAATVTSPPPAPHPAFVRTAFPSTPARKSALPGVFSFQFPVHSRAPNTEKAFLFARKDVEGSVQTSSFLRRMPTSSPSSRFPSELPTSRMPSSSSDYTSRSRSSSSSSRSRTPEPTTPLQVPLLGITAVQDTVEAPPGPGILDFATWFGNDPDILTVFPDNLDMHLNSDFLENKSTPDSALKINLFPESHTYIPAFP